MNFIALSNYFKSAGIDLIQNKISIIRQFSSLPVKDLNCYGIHNLKFTSLGSKRQTASYHFGRTTTIKLDSCNCQNVRPFHLGKIIFSNSVLDVNTNVIKDVILFRYENPKFYKFLNIFAICQFIFWGYLSHFAFTTLKDTPVEKENQESLPWWRKINLGENKYRNGITFLCFGIGYGILAAAWAFTLKSVRFLVLRKGGESITFVTYGPFGKNRMMTVPIKEVSCQESRNAARVQLPLKVKNASLYYVLDMRGEFTNPRLFDHTAGLKRAWNK